MGVAIAPMRLLGGVDSVLTLCGAALSTSSSARLVSTTPRRLCQPLLPALAEVNVNPLERPVVDLGF